MINWHTEKRHLRDLIEWDKNPRQLSKHDAEHIQRSLEKFGVADPLVINTDNLIIGGHQRKRILQMIASADPDYQVDVRVPDRQLTDEEVAELNIRLNKNSGNWDWDVLANEFEAIELIDWGFTEEQLGLMPKGDEWADAFAKLPDGDRAPFQQMTFTLHDIQVETINEALKISKSMGEFVDSENENSNGNALARVCELFIGGNG